MSLIYDMKIGKTGTDGKTFWTTIGTVFLPDGAKIFDNSGKKPTFNIHYPQANGIIVPREKKKQAQDAPPSNPEHSNDKLDSTE